MKPIRVMDLRSTYRWGGGPDKTILNSAKMHDENIVDTLVVYLRSEWDDEFILGKRAQEMGLNCVEIAEKSVVDIAAFKRVVSLIKEKNIQVVHSRDYKTNLMALIIKKFFAKDIKIITMAHGWVGNGFKLKAYYFLDRIMASFFDRNLILFKGQRKLFVRKPNKKTTIVVHNGIDYKDWNPEEFPKGKLRKEYGISKDTKIIGYTGRIMPEKDIITMVNVASELITNRKYDLIFVLVGESKTGTYGDMVKAAVKKNGLDDHFIFTGVRHDLKEILGDFDIFLMTSLQEGFPNSLLEVMAMKVPAVSAAVDGIPEILRNGEDALLCSTKDVECFADSVETLLNDNTKRDALVQSSRKLVETKLSFEYRLKKMEQIFQDLVSDKVTMALDSPEDLSEEIVMGA